MLAVFGNACSPGIKIIGTSRDKSSEHKLAVFHHNATIIKTISRHSVQHTHTHTQFISRSSYILVTEGQPGQSLKVCESNGDAHSQYFISIPLNDPVLSPKSLLHQLLSKKVIQECHTLLQHSFFPFKIPDFRRIKPFFFFFCCQVSGDKMSRVWRKGDLG